MSNDSELGRVSLTIVSITVLTVPNPAIAQTLDPLEEVSRQAFAELAHPFIRDAGLRLQFLSEDFRLGPEISEEALLQAARVVAEAMVFPRRLGGTVDLVSTAEARLTDEELSVIQQGLLESGLIRPGDRSADVLWRTEDARSVGTIAVVDSTGRPRFEPVLYLAGRSSSSSILERGSWLHRHQRIIENGFGVPCVEARWTVGVTANGSVIADPAPHVSIEQHRANCWLWEQATTEGEGDVWCRPGVDDVYFPMCQTRHGQGGEECVDWVVVTYVATGLTRVEVDASVGGTYRGIGTQLRVGFQVGRIGSEATFGTKGRLCALSGTR